MTQQHIWVSEVVGEDQFRLLHNLGWWQYWTAGDWNVRVLAYG